MTIQEVEKIIKDNAERYLGNIPIHSMWTPDSIKALSIIVMELQKDIRLIKSELKHHIDWKEEKL